MNNITVIEDVDVPLRGSFYEESKRIAFVNAEDNDKVYCYAGFYPYGESRYEVWMEPTEHFKEGAKSLIKIWKRWFKHMVEYESQRYCVVAQNPKLVRMIGFSEYSPSLTIMEEDDG